MTLETIFTTLGVETKKQEIMGKSSKEYFSEIELLLKNIEVQQGAKEILQKIMAEKLWSEYWKVTQDKKSFLPIVDYLKRNIIADQRFNRWLNQCYNFFLEPVENKKSVYHIIKNSYYGKARFTAPQIHSIQSVLDAGFLNTDLFLRSLEEHNERWGAVCVFIYTQKSDTHFELLPQVNLSID